MTRVAILTLGLIVSSPFTAHALDEDAKAQAQAILDKGSALFDKKDAAVMAATYTEDGQILWVAKEENSSEIGASVKKGRAEVETFYREVFKDPQEKTTSKNAVDFARLIAPDLMVIHGTFQPDVAKAGKYPFVQTRVKQGDKWLIKTLQFFVFSED
jgi:hypothetical protein